MSYVFHTWKNEFIHTRHDTEILQLRMQQQSKLAASFASHLGGHTPKTVFPAWKALIPTSQGKHMAMAFKQLQRKRAGAKAMRGWINEVHGQKV